MSEPSNKKSFVNTDEGKIIGGIRGRITKVKSPGDKINKKLSPSVNIKRPMSRE